MSDGAINRITGEALIYFLTDQTSRSLPELLTRPQY
jgi:hypothetical protein